MGRMSELAKNPYKGEGSEPNFRLRVNGRDFSRRVWNIKGVYTRDAGGSGMTVEIDGDYSRNEDDLVRLDVGYGNFIGEWFRGKLQNPRRHPITGRTVFDALGPFKEMWGSFGRDVDFTGENAATFFTELGRHARQGVRFLEVRGGFDVVIVDEGAFVAETQLLEAAKTIADRLDFVLLDRPGYKRLVMPTPAPGATSKSVTRYDEPDYPEEAFDPQPQTTQRFAKVVVFRRSDANGVITYPVWEEAAISHRGGKKPPSNRIAWVPEFPGNSRQAANTASRKARAYSKGLNTWELRDLWINPELLLFDTITVTRTNQAHRVPHLEIYSCLIDDSIEWEISQTRFHMALKGQTAVLRNEVPLRELPPRFSRIATGV